VKGFQGNVENLGPQVHSKGARVRRLVKGDSGGRGMENSVEGRTDGESVTRRRKGRIMVLIFEKMN